MTFMVPAVNVADLKETTLLNMGIFALFVAVTMIIVIKASRNNKTAADYYAAGRSFTGPQNGTAIAGDYLSAASFLGITGAIAINGYDGFMYSIGFLVAWLVALLLVAELLRNTGKFTMADVLSFRLKQRPVRIAAAISTLAVCFFYLLAQMAGAGSLISLLLGISDWGGQALVIIVVGALMIMYVLIGGMKGTTWVQIIKAMLLIAGAAVMTFWVLAIYGFNLSDLLGGAVETSGNPNILNPGLQYGKTETSKLDFMSLGLALVLGTAALPHVLMRFYTVPTAKEARKSVVWSIWLIGLFYLFTLVLGYGAAALVGADTIKAAPGGVNSAAPLLAFHLGGPLLLGFISAVAFATILAVVAGLDDHRGGIVRPRHLRQRHCQGQGRRRHRGQGGAQDRGRDRPPGHRRRHLRQRTERRVPRGARLRGGGLGQPAHHRVLAVLAQVHHPGRHLEHVRRARLGDHPDRAVPGGLGCQDVHDPGRQLRDLPAQQPRHRLHPARVLPGLARFGAGQEAGRHHQAGRNGSPLPHGCGRRKGHRPLSITRW